MYNRSRILIDDRLGTSATIYWDAVTYNGYNNTTVEHSSQQTVAGDDTVRYKTMDDVVVENFYKKRREGVIMNNPMHEYDSYVIDNPLSINANSTKTWVYKSKTSRTTIDVYGNLSTKSVVPTVGRYAIPPVLDINALRGQAITSAWANIKGNDLLVPAMAAEGNKTVDGLKYILKKVYRIAKYVKKMQLKALKYELRPKELKEIYMNARYNLRPLSYDAVGVLDYFFWPAKKQFMRQTFRAVKDNTFYSESAPVVKDFASLSVNGSFIRVTSKRSSERLVTVRAGVLTATSDVAGQRLGFDRIIDVAWELTPYSFIIDWFANVGETISSFVPVAGFKPLTSWVVVEDASIHKTHILDVALSPPSTGVVHGPVSFSGEGHITTVIDKVRYPEYARPILPQFRVNLNPAKLLDLAYISQGLFNANSYSGRRNQSRRRHYATINNFPPGEYR